ncbi:MAG: hypothetical protein HY069_01920, partial [Chlamydiia bacterium]|nr:hypothetical protein [Chlamydiia bacterium]
MENASPIKVVFDRFNLKGYGIGLLPNQKEVEVPHALPGDTAHIDWKKKKRPPQKGRLL